MNIFKPFLKPTPKQNRNANLLEIEPLEERQMLSTVDIVAAGATGQETIELVIAGETVATFENVGGNIGSRDFVTLSYNADSIASIEDIEVRFTNDLFDPAAGIDRNVLIDRLIVRFGPDGTPEERDPLNISTFNFETEHPSVFSTGSWTSDDGIVDGFNRGEILHSNGSFRFDGTPVARGGFTGANFGYGSGTLVQVNASGSTGHEQFNLLIDDRVVATFDAHTDPKEFRYASNRTLSADQIKIEFINDFYDPANGIDRNLNVSSIRLNDALFQTEASTTLSTGTYADGVGIVTGFPQSETLHVNGFFQFLAGDGSIDVDFLNETWQVGSEVSSGQVLINPSTGNLEIKGVPGQEASISRTVEIAGGQLVDFSVDAYRRIESGQFNASAQPWATVGVNFVDASGNFISQQTIEVNSPRDSSSNGFKSKQFLTPDNAVSATIWMWTDDVDQGVSIPLVVRDIQLNATTSGDTTPPSVELQGGTIIQSRNVLQFVLNVTDDSGLASINGPNTEVTLTGPNGFSVDFNSVAGGGLPNGTFFIYELSNPNGPSWTSADNGTYTVTVNGGEFQDAVGNVVATQTVGSFVISV